MVTPSGTTGSGAYAEARQAGRDHPSDAQAGCADVEKSHPAGYEAARQRGKIGISAIPRLMQVTGRAIAPLFCALPELDPLRGGLIFPACVAAAGRHSVSFSRCLSRCQAGLWPAGKALRPHLLTIQTIAKRWEASARCVAAGSRRRRSCGSMGSGCAA